MFLNIAPEMSIETDFELIGAQNEVKPSLIGGSSDTQNGLMGVPKDIWESIFKNLDRKNKRNIRLVCRKWRKIVDSRFKNLVIISNVDITKQVVKLFNSIHSQNGLNTKIVTNDFVRNDLGAPRLRLDQEVRILDSKLSDMEKNTLLNASFIFIDDGENVFFIENTKIKMKSILNVQSMERAVDLPCEVSQVRLFFHHNERLCLVAEKSIFFYEIPNLKIITTCEIRPLKSHELILKQNDLLIFDQMVFDLNALKSFVVAIDFVAGRHDVKCSKKIVAVLDQSELFLKLYSISFENGQYICMLNRTIDLTRKNYKHSESSSSSDYWTIEDIKDTLDSTNILLKERWNNFSMIVDENGKVILKRFFNPEIKRSLYKVKLVKHIFIESYKGLEGQLCINFRNEIDRSYSKNNYSCTSIPSSQLIIENFEISTELDRLTILFKNIAKTAQRSSGQGSVCYYEQFSILIPT